MSKHSKIFLLLTIILEITKIKNFFTSRIWFVHFWTLNEAKNLGYDFPVMFVVFFFFKTLFW